MLRVITDEDFNRTILNGLLRRNSALDVIRVQDIVPLGTGDPELLELAALEGRILLTHDVTTMTNHLYERIRLGKSSPGILVVTQTAPIGRVIEDLLLVIECSFEEELMDRVIYVPL
jgi:hypothetical protein